MEQVKFVSDDSGRSVNSVSIAELKRRWSAVRARMAAQDLDALAAPEEQAWRDAIQPFILYRD